MTKTRTLVVGACAGLMLLWACGPKKDVAPKSASQVSWPTVAIDDSAPRLTQWLRGKVDAAKAEVQAAPDKVERAAQVIGDLGVLLDAWGHDDEALQCYTSAATLAPTVPRWVHLQALVHLREGRPEQAAGVFRALLEQSPSAPAVRTYLGEIALEAGDLEQATKWFREVLEAGPDARAHRGLGRVLMRQGRAEEAVTEFEAALALQPQASGERVELGEALLEVGRTADAAAAFAEAGRVPMVLSDPSEKLRGDAKVQSALEFTAAMARDSQIPLAEVRGFLLEHLSGRPDAIEELERMAAGDGDAPDPMVQARFLYLQGLIGVSLQDGQGAAARIGRAVELAPSFTEGWLELGNVLTRLGDLDGAGVALDRAVEVGGNGDALRSRARLRLNRGDGAGALADLRTLAQARPTDGSLRVQIAEFREVQRDLEGAFTALQGSLADESLPPTERALVARGLGDFLLRRARHDQALLAYRRAVELDPGLWQARQSLAEILGHLGRWPEAVTEFDAVLAEHPDNESARRGQLLSLVLQREWTRFATELGKGLEALPNSPALAEIGARFLAASPEAELRDPQRALELAYQAWNAGQGPKRADAVAIAWGASARYAEALEWQRRAVELGLDQREAAGRLAAFEKGEPWFARTPIELLGLPG